MKDAFGHGSNGLGNRIQQVVARGHNQTERAAAHEWMGDGIARKPGSEVMYDRAMAAAKGRDDADAALALHSGGSKSDLAPVRPGANEIASLKERLRSRGFAAVRS